MTAIVDPTRSALSGEAALHGRERAIAEAQRIFARQQEARWKNPFPTAAERVEKLRALRAAIERRRGEIIQSIKDDFGKHPTETDLTEIQLALTELNHAIANTPRWMRTRRVRTPMHLFGTRSEIRREPKGVVLIMSAWNFPFALLMAPLVPAIAAGNRAILRPSEKVPAANRVLAALMADVFDETEVGVVEGDATVANALLSMPFDHIFFTGSTRIGKVVMAAAAQTLASVTLELGGKSPALVDDSADIKIAAERIVWGKFASSGQACVAPDYALVHASRATEFVAEAKRVIARFYGDTEEAREKSADVARVVDQRAAERLAGLVQEAVKRGAIVECGGRWDIPTRYVAPTILSGVDINADIMAEEIFGPVLPVVTYRTPEEAYRIIGSRGKPLAMYIFSTRRDNIESALRNTSAGGTSVNHTLLHLSNPYLPFGGVRESGFGTYHGEWGFQTFSHERSVLRQGPFTVTSLVYPPYGPHTARIAKWLSIFRG
jgi:aldehyde dehydrogenase (NAD+)